MKASYADALSGILKLEPGLTTLYAASNAANLALACCVSGTSPPP